MVKIAVAGGSGAVAQEVIEALVATKRHDILILSRREFPTRSSNVSWAQVDYTDIAQLATILTGVEVLLSFIVVLTDPGNLAQKNLIDAAVKAGVRRFAPSEWATSSVEWMPWYSGKAEVRRYLETLNQSGKVLEYCLFHPGMFTEYLVHPYSTAKHFRSFETQFDFYNRRALVREGGLDDVVTLTALPDFVNVVVQAIEYPGEWPVVGGIRGSNITVGELIALGKKVRGAAFDIETLSTEDLKAEKILSTWKPTVDHPSIPPEQAGALADKFLAGVLLAISVGAFQVSDEWNRLLPGCQFIGAEEFLSSFWRDKQ